jgi:hypothetical protein
MNVWAEPEIRSDGFSAAMLTEPIMACYCCSTSGCGTVSGSC